MSNPNTPDQPRGALSDPLTKQLDGLILPATLAHLDADANAITRLVVRGYLPDSQAHRAREKLLKKIREETAKSARHLGRSNTEARQPGP